MLTKPDEGTFNKLTVKVNGGPNEDAMDSFPVPFVFDAFAIDNLTDQDVDEIVQVVVDRIIAEHPDYVVYVDKSWSGGTHSDPRNTVYTPPAP
ncbi:hypothetical protein [Streptomyces cylindrosporus]|uniref:Uncharacterized protein n=1 Tax=Streptomyces cylindrosporus TaxID=2927583 RepID=A0ABS9YQJ1_9ACTN|nr:hypothetical protein [Streptomyces cylindrosporus]MCI3279209.1 hypothetical protein [Streptomyces cylindrosporus]